MRELDGNRQVRFVDAYMGIRLNNRQSTTVTSKPSSRDVRLPEARKAKAYFDGTRLTGCIGHSILRPLRADRSSGWLFPVRNFWPRILKMAARVVQGLQMAPERRTTLELDRETIQRIVQNLDPGLVADGFARLHGGSTEVYRIDFAGADCEPLVLKIYPDEPEWGPAKEKLVAGWFTELTPLAPKWLAIDESRSLLPLRYALLPLLPGRSLRGWVAEPDIDNAYRQMGALLRHIHAMPMPAYGYVLGHGIAKPMPTNADYMTSAFEDVFRRFRDFGGDADLGRRLQQLAEGSFDLLRESSGAVLCHDDFHQGNVLALRTDPGGLQLSGLVDFGNARAADKLFDLAKALFCSAHEDPRSRKPILEGYGALDHPDIERALWLYTLFHRVSMWCWLTKLGLEPTNENGPGGLIRDLRTMTTGPGSGLRY